MTNTTQNFNNSARPSSERLLGYIHKTHTPIIPAPIAWPKIRNIFQPWYQTFESSLVKGATILVLFNNNNGERGYPFLIEASIPGKRGEWSRPNLSAIMPDLPNQFKFHQNNGKIKQVTCLDDQELNAVQKFLGPEFNQQ